MKRERAELAHELAQFDADRLAGVKNPKGYRAEFYRHQIAELDEVIRDEERREG